MTAKPQRPPRPAQVADGAEPEPACSLCPRLATFRAQIQTENPSWFNGAVPSFGQDNAELLIVGLAPGLQGANRTGRPFTGDYAGDLLYDTLLAYKFAAGRYLKSADDGLLLQNCMITNAVRCVPPKNKPVTAEINTCRQFLFARIASLPNLKVILALGKIAHDSVVRCFGHPLSKYAFGHAKTHFLDMKDQGPTSSPLQSLAPTTLIDSYHCSRYNTNTRRLTEQMFQDVFSDIKARLAPGQKTPSMNI